ncbi:MAG: hypothetical protein R3E83_01805 [Burkholderiaceae bacterium]
MKSTLKTVSIAAAAAIALLAGGAAQAGDCKKVKFQFTNNMGTKIKVKSVEIKGNDGTWTEDIANKEILTGNKYTTDGRTMNKLDSGKAPDYQTVKYDQWDAANGRWLNNKTKKFTNRKVCNDGHTYVFNMQ